MFVLVPAEYQDIATDVDASHYVSSDFFADGFLEYLVPKLSLLYL